MRWDEPAVAEMVLDASVAVRWVVDEPGSPEAAALLERPIRWIGPHLLMTEIASTLRRMAVAGAMTAGEAQQRLRFFTSDMRERIELVPDDRVIDAALDAALTLGHRVADCVYLALAEYRAAALATADVALAEMARQRRVAVVLVPTR